MLSYELVVPGVDARTGLFTAVSAEGAVHGSGCAADSRPGQAPGRPTTRSIRSVLRGMPGPASLHKTLAFPPASAPAQYRLIANGTYSSDQDAWQPGQVGARGRPVAAATPWVHGNRSRPAATPFSTINTPCPLHQHYLVP